MTDTTKEIGKLSKRYGVQPETARAGVLLALANGPLDAGGLVNASDYETDVWPQLAVEMCEPKYNFVEFARHPEKPLKKIYSITHLGLLVVEDLKAYRDIYVVRKAENYYYRAYSKLEQTLALRDNERWRWQYLASDISGALNPKTLPDHSLAGAKAARANFLTQLSKLTPIIAEKVEDRYRELSKGGTGTDCAGWCNQMSKYHEQLKAEGVDSNFSPKFLRQLMIGKLGQMLDD